MRSLGYSSELDIEFTAVPVGGGCPYPIYPVPSVTWRHTIINVTLRNRSVAVVSTTAS
jgi:hypothetical protein